MVRLALLALVLGLDLDLSLYMYLHLSLLLLVRRDWIYYLIWLDQLLLLVLDRHMNHPDQ